MSNPSQPAAGRWSEQDLIASVEAGPKGPDIGAFFDFDGTLIAILKTLQMPRVAS